MADPLCDIESKLQRAVRALLMAAGTCGGPLDILESEALADKVFPNTSFDFGVTTPEVLNTGIDRVHLMISIKGAAGQEPVQDVKPSDDGPQDPPIPPVSPAIAFEQRVAATRMVLRQTVNNNPNLVSNTMAGLITAAGRALAVPADASPAAQALAAANVDMLDFTCQAWFDKGQGKGQSNDSSWEKILLFEAIACAANVD